MRYHQRLPREPRREPPQKNPVLEAKPCQEAEPDKQILLMAALLARSPANTGAMLESMLPHIGPPAERERLKTALRYGCDLRCADGVQRLRVLSRCTRQTVSVERVIARTKNLQSAMEAARSGNLLSALSGMMPMMGNAAHLLEMLRANARRQ